MSALSIQVPFPVFNDRDGQPLDNGYVWIGVPNLPPQTNPVNVYFDDALTILATQPLRTINGYISRAGSPAQVYIDGVNFSILVQDSNGTMVYNFPEGTGIDPNATGIDYDPGPDSLLLPGGTISVKSALDQITDEATGSSIIGFEQAGSGVVPRSAQSKLRETISIKDFGAVGDGVTDDTAAIQDALDTGKSIYVPDGNYLVTDTLTITTPWQEVYGAGRGSAQITFTFASSKIGLDIQPAGGLAAENIIVSHLFLLGTANVSKLVNIGGPQVQILNNRLRNNTSGGSVIWLEDENIGTGVYNFGARIAYNLIYGSLAGGTGGGFGIYLGLYNQSTSICFNNIENNNTHVYVNGATSQITIDSNVMQRCNDTQQAIYLNKDGSAMPCYEVNITRNYFEQVHLVVVLDNANFQNLVISHNFAYRSTAASKLSSAFYVTGANTSAGTQNIWVENNHVEDYNAVFLLDGEYGATRLISTKGNSLNGTTNWAVGTYATHAYTTRQTNAFFTKKITAGAIVAESVLRIESVSCTYEVPIQWETHETAERLRFYYVPVGAAQVVVNLYKRNTSASAPAAVLVATLTATTEAFHEIALSGLADPLTQYYAEVTTSGGTASYTYPFNLYLRA